MQSGVEEFRSGREFVVVGYTATLRRLLIWGIANPRPLGDEGAVRIEICFTGVVAQKTRCLYSGIRIDKVSGAKLSEISESSHVEVAGKLECWSIGDSEGTSDYVIAHRCDVSRDDGDWNSPSEFSGPPGVGLHHVL